MIDIFRFSGLMLLKYQEANECLNE